VVVAETVIPPGQARSWTGPSGPISARLQRQRGAVVHAAAEHGVRALRIFGSLARGEESVDSDVDLLGTLDPGRTLLDLLAASAALRDLLGAPVDLATLDLLKPRVRAAALEELVAL